MERLDAFLGELLEPFGRLERRRWGNVYVHGLVLDGERKSTEPMAGHLPGGNVQATMATSPLAASANYSIPSISSAFFYHEFTGIPL